MNLSPWCLLFVAWAAPTASSAASQNDQAAQPRGLSCAACCLPPCGKRTTSCFDFLSPSSSRNYCHPANEVVQAAQGGAAQTQFPANEVVQAQGVDQTHPANEVVQTGTQDAAQFPTLSSFEWFPQATRSRHERNYSVSSVAQLRIVARHLRYPNGPSDQPRPLLMLAGDSYFDNKSWVSEPEGGFSPGLGAEYAFAADVSEVTGSGYERAVVASTRSSLEGDTEIGGSWDGNTRLTIHHRRNSKSVPDWSCPRSSRGMPIHPNKHLELNHNLSPF